MNANDPRHGTTAGTTCIRRPHSYWTTCDCTDCTLDRRRKGKAHSAGRPYRLPAEAAWEVLEDRIQRGWTALAIASACGLDPNYFSPHLADYRRGSSRRHIGPNLVPIILAMGRPTAGQVGAEPTRRRLRALARIGYSLTTLSDRTGVKLTTLSMIRSRNERCTAVVANAVTDIYNKLHMTPGDNADATHYATTHEWPAPLAWDNIDDLDETPTGVYKPPGSTAEYNIERAAKRLAYLEHAVEHGHTLERVTADLDLTRKAILRWCQRNERRDIWATLAERSHDYDERHATAGGAVA